MLDGSYYIECTCEDLEHVTRLTVDKDEKCIFVEYFLAPYLPWYKRIWVSLKYIFTHKCGDLLYADLIWRQDSIEKIKTVFSALEDALEENVDEIKLINEPDDTAQKIDSFDRFNFNALFHEAWANAIYSTAYDKNVWHALLNEIDRLFTIRR